MTRSGFLSIVATPIGNLGDFSTRAGETLSKADIIACEDTRVTKKLLRLTGTSVSAKIMAYHDHNGEKMRPYLLQRMAGGDHIALVSDAGTPLISDPGYKLVAACQTAGIAVTTTPGPSAVIAGLTVSGLPTDRFMFAGFIPGSANARAKAFSEIADISATMIWFDAPSRLARNLLEMADILGQRQACITRELTKLHEETMVGDLRELAERVASMTPMKGELVLVVAGRTGDVNVMDDTALTKLLRAEMDGQRLRDAVANVVSATGIAKNRVYRIALAVADDSTMTED
ncbi:MAG: 16S rRNA (cytidine(1402)-2'-O)-methyltransferase [Rhodospirillaceae bacterium]|nr:16S rRNA (cytidine(1402)-2'-O)-methyltransferase [Rhodospirillaceae bacterium]|tara:strand:+ start:316 stop:1179 length:864 start_codon:yes stop_codon:yes gene_type:complete